MKNGYKALVCSHNWNPVQMPLKLCWDGSCLPKVGLFLWLALQKRILRADRLSRFSIIGPSWCELCKNNNEDMDNLLYRCPFVQVCWDWLRLQLRWSSPLPKSLLDFIIAWPTNLVYGVYSKL